MQVARGAEPRKFEAHKRQKTNHEPQDTMETPEDALEHDARGHDAQENEACKRRKIRNEAVDTNHGPPDLKRQKVASGLSTCEYQAARETFRVRKNEREWHLFRLGYV